MEQQQAGVKVCGAISMAEEKTAAQPQISFLQVHFQQPRYELKPEECSYHMRNTQLVPC